MIDLAIMIEGQNGLNWPRWKRIVRAAEDLKFAGLYRSDHYTNMSPPDKDSLELWVSLTWLADNSKTLDFGPLVTPVSFRTPTMTARMAAAVDDLSNGRMTLGLGAGWQEREHKNYGWDLLEIPDRFNRFEEGLVVITKLLKNDTPTNFHGEYYFLEDGILLPRPNRKGGPPILIGGNGPLRTLPLAARYADEWNATTTPKEKLIELSGQLNELLSKNDRRPSEVRRSYMTGCIYGKNDTDVNRKVEGRWSGKFTVSEIRQRGLIAGTASEIVDQVMELGEIGVQRIMIQWLDLDDLDGLEYLANKVLPQL